MTLLPKVHQSHCETTMPIDIQLIGGVQSDRIRLRRFIYAHTDTWQWQRIYYIIFLCKPPSPSFCSARDTDNSVNSLLILRIVMGVFLQTADFSVSSVMSSTGRIVSLISKDVYLLLSTVIHSLVTSFPFLSLSPSLSLSLSLSLSFCLIEATRRPQ